MADYGLKYLCEYRSKMRDRLLYRIEIEERDAVALTDATALRIRPYSDVFTLKWGNSDDPEYTAVKGSSLTLKILCVDDMEYLSLFSVDPLKFRVTIYEYRTDESGEDRQLFLWRGFLSASSYKETFARPPYVVTLSATDGFALLDSMPYLNAGASRYYGMSSMRSILNECLEMLSLDLPVSDWVSIDGVGGLERSMGNIYLDRTRIYDIQTDISWKKVLELILKPFMAQIFQAYGVIHCRGIDSLSGSFRPPLFYPQQVIGGTRSRSVRMWQEKCDIRASSELQLCAPYRNVIVSVDNGRSGDSSRIFYDDKMWTVDRDTTHVMYVGYLRTRFVYYGYKQPVWMKFPYSIHIGSGSEISVSLRIANMRPVDKLSANIVVIARTQSETLVWDNEDRHWEADQADYSPNVVVESSNISNESYLIDPVSLPGEEVQISISEAPGLEKYDLSLRIYAYNGDVFTPTGFFAISDISIGAGTDNERSDSISVTMPVSKNRADECRVDVPIRDAGYYANMEAFLTCPILNSDGSAVVSWLSARERGDLLHVVGETVVKLRSTVVRQLDGELRCRGPVDMNSIFVDDRFTGAEYYVNSLELHASRQVYSVQLRELRRNVSLIWSELKLIRSFSESVRLSCSLYRSLFLVVGDDICRVVILDIDTNEIRDISLYGKGVQVRKGLGAVVIQMSDGIVYAVDNAGNILSSIDSSELPEDQIGQIEFDITTALYDADRRVWVSMVKNIYEKTAIVLMSDDMEILSRTDLSIVATDMKLMSNGYVLTCSDGSTWWHNYELHSSEKIEASDSLVVFVSDSLVVAIDEITIPKVRYSVRRRSGQLFDAQTVIERISVPRVSSSFVQRVVGNCAIVAFIYMGAANQRVVTYYDARTGRQDDLLFDTDVDAAVCGDCLYIMNGSELLGVRPRDIKKYGLYLDYEDGDISLNSPAAGRMEPIDVVTGGTPYVVSKDARLAVSVEPSGYIYRAEVVVPANTSGQQITYDPVVIGIREDELLTRSITIVQAAD